MEYIFFFALGFFALGLALNRNDKLSAKEQKHNNEPIYIMVGIIVYVLYISIA